MSPVSVDLRLDAKAFVGLGAFSESAHSLLSPWNSADVRVDDETRARLMDAGAIDANGVGHELRAALNAMATATASTSLKYIGSGMLIEFLLWTSRDHRTVGVSAASDDTLRLQDPPPTEKVLTAIADLVGRSGLRALDLSLRLPIDDAFVVAALVDTQRHRLLRTIASNGENPAPTVGVTEIAAALDDEASSATGFVDAVARLCLTSAPAAERIADAVARLANRGIVQGDPSALRLVGPLAELPTHFPLVRAAVELANACVTDAAVRRVRFVCLQAGVSDLLLIEGIDDQVRFEVVSADTVVGYIECFLRTPDFGRRPQQAPASSQPGPISSQRTQNLATPARPERRWLPTHLAPERGLPAFSAPDPSSRPVARLGPRAEVRVLERAGQWARIVGTNGWSGWVDGRALTELRPR